MGIRVRNSKEPNLFIKLANKLQEILLGLSTITTFLGIFPLIIYIYYNLFYFNPIKVLIGCVTVITLMKLNKGIQGGN